MLKKKQTPLVIIRTRRETGESHPCKHVADCWSVATLGSVSEAEPEKSPRTRNCFSLRSVSSLRGLSPLFARRDRKGRMPEFAAPVIPLCRAAFILSLLKLTVWFRSLYHFPFGDIRQSHGAFTGLIIETEQRVSLRDNTKQTPEYWILCGPKKKVMGI